MLRLVLRNLVARKVRLLLSGFAIVLGVSFVCGSFVFTDALGRAFDGIIRGTTPEALVSVEGYSDVISDTRTSAPTLPATTLAPLRELPEVADAVGNVEVRGVYVVGADGKLVGGMGPPGLGMNYTEIAAISGDPILVLADGRLPKGSDEVALDVSTAERAGYEIGDQVTVVTSTDRPQLHLRLTALVRFGSDDGLAGATLTIFDERAAQDLFFEGRDVYTSIGLTAADGVSQEELADAVRRALPADLAVETGDDVAEEQAASITEMLGFVNTFLLVFAAVAMVVGAFLIVNTFSILVAQRSRELALLRALGASRGQVDRAVLGEALGVGTVGSTVGIGLGYLLALALRALFGVIGMDISGSALPLAPRTVLVAYGVGVLVTMAAAYLPARRAGRVAVIEGIRGLDVLGETGTRRRTWTGAGLVVAGAAAIVLGLRAGLDGLPATGAGMLAVLVGVALNASLIGRPLLGALGAAYRRAGGAVGKLASENARRNPRRTGSTASALMVGLALVATMSILGLSAKQSTDRAIEESLTADLMVSSMTQQPFSASYGARIAGIDGVDAVAAIRAAMVRVDGQTTSVAAVDPAAIGAALDLSLDRGSLGDLGGETVALGRDFAAAEGLEVGDRFRVTFPSGEREFLVGGTYPATGVITTEVLLTLDQMEAAGYEPADSVLLIELEDDAPGDQVRAALDDVVAGDPTVTLQDSAELAEQQRQVIDSLLYVVYALLALSVVIALLGVTNTLALSVIERTHEIGLMRALGLGRRQLRTMIRLESVAIAVLGASLGVVLGVGFGVTLQRSLQDQGIDVLGVPWLQLGGLVVLAAVVGVLAAAVPARRAARLNVLAAVAHE